MSYIKNGIDLTIKARLSDVELNPSQMHNYQRVGVQFAMENPFCGLLIDLGLGKSVIAGTVMANLFESFEIEKALIVAPLRVANRTWPDEIRKWSHLAPYPFEMLTVPGVERSSAALSKKPIHIINRENIPWLVDFYKSRWPYDMVIIDESSSFKDHKSKRFQKLAAVRERGLIKRMIELTASPLAESYQYLFAQIYLLDGGERFTKYPTKFQSRYFDFNRYTHSLTLRDGCDSEIESAIADIALVMRAEDYLDMTECHYVKNTYTLSDSVMELYKKMMRDSLVEIGDHEIEAVNAAALAAKLRQLCSGFMYNTYSDYNPETDTFDTCKDIIFIHDERTAEMMQIIEACPDENILIAYHFKESLERIKAALPKAVVMDKAGNCVTRWNKGLIKHLIAHPQSAGHGLNLQKGGRRIIYYDMPESQEHYSQFIGRLNRQGQKDAVFIHHLIALGTKDELVYAAQKKKASVQDKFYASLKRLQRKYLKELKGKVDGENH